MPTAPTYPGVYIEEVPSQVRTIAGVATSITAFVGRARRGPVDRPVRVQGFAEFDRRFGGLWRESPMTYAVQQFFLNGGTDALVVRVFDAGEEGSMDDAHARFELPGDGGSLLLRAADPGLWGNRLQLLVDHDTADPADALVFNLTVNEVRDGVTVAGEVHRNLSVEPGSRRDVVAVLRQSSDLVRVVDGSALPTERPQPNLTDPDGRPVPVTVTGGGTDGEAIDFDQVADPGLEADRRGIWALEHADLFNLLCIPPFEPEADVDPDTWTAALAYCKRRRAMLLVDPPSAWENPADVQDGTTGADGSAATVPARDENAAVYFPRVRLADPEQDNRLRTFAPCGVVAGVIARTDGERGVWKAPAGQDAQLLGVRELAYRMTDGENGQLNPLGVNCLRTFPVTGHVVWGARTTEGADRLASEWKYVPVRRLALYIEESLYRGTQWVIFEPNDEPLWAQIRLNVGAFMNNLFRQGAFQGRTPREAYFVKCDRETTTQNDIDRGIVNLLVGFAPLKPAEFLIIRISQIAGDVQT